MSQIVHDSQYAAGGHQQISVADTAINLFVSYLSLIQRASTVTGKTDTKISATSILITPIDQPIYYTLYGTPATNGDTGHPCPVGTTLIINGWRNILGFKMIRQGSNTAKVNITAFFNEPGV
jgi:hypothetical protein